MKKLILCLLLVSHISFAKTGPEWFSQAEKDEIKLEGGYSFYNKQLAVDDDEKEESARTDIDFEIEYGFWGPLSAGFEQTYSSDGAHTGLGDQNFFIKSSGEHYTAQFDLYLSLGDSADDNFISGGNHFGLSAAYLLNEYLSFRFEYIPEYDFEYEDADNSLTNKERLSMFGHLEFTINEKLIGGGIGHIKIGSTENKGTSLTRPSSFIAINGYVVIEYEDLELLPEVNQWLYIGEDSDKEGNITILDFKVRTWF